jgi:hypothetical protein
MSGKKCARGFAAGLASFLLAAITISFAGGSAQAAPIHGGISFSGDVTAFLSASGMGSEAMDFISAHSLVFGSTTVASSPTGTFSVIPSGTSVTLYTPLQINPTALPSPSTTALWKITTGGVTYSFTLSSALSEPVVTSNALELTGSGTFSDSISSADSSPGTYVATFTTSGCTYSWNASGKAIPVPEPTSMAVLSCCGVGLLSRRRRSVSPR